LVDFFDHAALARDVIELCNDPLKREKMGLQARLFAEENYDLEKHCLPKQIDWVMRLAE
jgi:glycosyltransferase involved in cell wall biosynthesis